jgi:predicted double-glycine peptidase
MQYRMQYGTAPFRIALSVTAALMTCLLVLGPFSASFAQNPESVDSLIEMRHRNVVIQQWDLSCGAAALATIFNYQHGLSVTEREIAIGMMGREEYLANPDIVNYRRGFSLLDLKRFVEARGFSGIGLGQLRFEDLEENAPIIVPISVHGYQHFVVFRGSLGNRVLVADPAFGNRTMSRSDFEKRWLALPGLGHVGFYVERRDGLIPPNQLASRPDDFMTIR